MHINKLKTKDGQEIGLGKFTVLIGPNNVGKSQTLKDVHNKFTQGNGFATTLVKSIVCEEPEGISDLFYGLDVKPDPKVVGRSQISGITSKLNSSDNLAINIEHIERQVKQNGINSIFGSLAKYRVSYLDSESRLVVAKTSPSINTHKHTPQNLMQALYAAENDVENSLREAFQTTFEMDIKLDYSGLTELCFRVSKRFDGVPSDSKESFKYFENYPILDDQGDGYRSFVGVVLSLLLSENRIVLLDEPEAFLHPAQARTLGLWIANHAHSVPGQVVISTHNSNFIAGVLAANKPVDIFRLNRKDDVTTFTQISPQSTKALARSPVLSSQRVLDALFHRGVAVCEADSDRIVYSTVSNNEFNNQELLFIHAHNKQTVHVVLELLISANIPCGAVVDFDILNDLSDLERIASALGTSINENEVEIVAKVKKYIESLDDSESLAKLKDDLRELLTQLESDEHSFSGARGAVNRIRKDFSKWRDVKSEGSKVFPPELLREVEVLISSLNSKCIFIAPVGELEGWIDVGTKRKNKWIVPALEYLGENPAPSELKEFVGTILNTLVAGKL